MTRPLELSDEDGYLLVKTSRHIVTEYLKTKKIPNMDNSFQAKFSFESGVFVTLNTNTGLRGCIGFPLPTEKLFKALSDAAIAAATQDPRFEPVKLEDLENISFEVTVLTPPYEIKVDNPNDYLSKIKVGRDGLIVKHSSFTGLLLPQVPVEYGWSSKEFLEHTCEKAGLAKNYWMKKETKILKFEGIVFKEEMPLGNVIREKLV